MTLTVPTCEPTELTIGSAWAWDVVYPDFRSDEGWTLSYYLQSLAGPTGLTLAAGTEVTADGSGGFEVRVPRTTTDDLTTYAGAYILRGRVFKASDAFDGHLVYIGNVLVLADPASAVSGKSWNRQRLEALQAAVIEEGGDQALYKAVSANGRSVEFLTPEERTREITHYTILVALEENPDAKVVHAGEFVNA